MPFCVLAPRSLQRKGVFFCSRASMSLMEAISESSQRAPACLLQRGGYGKGFFQDFAATWDGDFPFFPWWKEVQRKSTHRGVPFAMGREGAQPLESSARLTSPGFPHGLSSSWGRVHRAWRTGLTTGCGQRRKHPIVKDTGFRERHPNPLPGAPAR